VELNERVLADFIDVERDRPNGGLFRACGCVTVEMLTTLLLHHVENGQVSETQPTPTGSLYIVEGNIQTFHQGADPYIETYWIVVGNVAKFVTAGLK
jgi:hypothetical protein